MLHNGSPYLACQFLMKISAFLRNSDPFFGKDLAEASAELNFSWFGRSLLSNNVLPLTLFLFGRHIENAAKSNLILLLKGSDDQILVFSRILLETQLNQI